MCHTQSPIFIYNKGNLENLPPSPAGPCSKLVLGSKNRLNKSSKVLVNTLQRQPKGRADPKLMYYVCASMPVYNYMLYAVALYIYTAPSRTVLTRVCLGRVARRRANKPRIRRVVPAPGHAMSFAASSSAVCTMYMYMYMYMYSRCVLLPASTEMQMLFT